MKSVAIIDRFPISLSFNKNIVGASMPRLARLKGDIKNDPAIGIMGCGSGIKRLDGGLRWIQVSKGGHHLPIDAHCVVCGFKLGWKLVLGKKHVKAKWVIRDDTTGTKQAIPRTT